MSYLLAQGPEASHRWRKRLPQDVDVVVGRTAEPWSVGWDPHISRRHVTVRWQEERLDVRVLSEARNPVFFRGRSAVSFALGAGESFVIGSTTFTLEDARVVIAVGGPQPAGRRAFDSHALRQRQFLYSGERMDVLAKLPELLADVISEDEWVVQLVSLVLAGVPRAGAAALVVSDDREAGESLRLRHWDRRGPASGERVFAPQANLIRQAIAERATVLHLWDESHGAWAYCTPLPGLASRGWVLYLAGVTPAGIAGEEAAVESQGWSERLQDDVKFTELVAATAGRLRDTQRLLRRQTALRPFFSPVVLEALGERDSDEVLAPREVEASVLFCDLRGSSRAAETQAHDLRGLLRRVSDALSAMTRHILAEGGVIGDFHGDAAMGFWGWPLPQADGAERACRAALAIREEFAEAARRAAHPLAGFRIGIGVATGRAVAGKIGSVDQVKVTVFGPVANRASRLESLTKRMGAAILIDEPTALRGAESLPPDVARVRKVARVRPPGFETTVDVCELVSRSEEDRGTPEQWRAFDAAAAAFRAGDWTSAARWLRDVPAQDRVKDFLWEFMARHGFQPPAHWAGVVDIA